MFHVSWSVCLCLPLSVCCAHQWALQKRLNRLTCHLQGRLLGPRNRGRIRSAPHDVYELINGARRRYGLMSNYFDRLFNTRNILCDQCRPILKVCWSSPICASSESRCRVCDLVISWLSFVTKASFTADWLIWTELIWTNRQSYIKRWLVSGHVQSPARQRHDLLRTDWLQPVQWTRLLSSEHMHCSGTVHIGVRELQFSS